MMRFRFFIRNILSTTARASQRRDVRPYFSRCHTVRALPPTTVRHFHIDLPRSDVTVTPQRRSASSPRFPSVIINHVYIAAATRILSKIVKFQDKYFENFQ